MSTHTPARSDSELIDALEYFVKNNQPLCIWLGNGKFPGEYKMPGLSLLGGTRTLREALGNLCAPPKTVDAQREPLQNTPEATQQGETLGNGQTK